MKTLIIAEAGVNHNGSLDMALKMVDAAKAAGADYVKFQTFVPEKLVSVFAGKAEYQKKNSAASESQLEMLRKLVLSQQEFLTVREYCEKVKIGFLSTPFELESIDFLNGLDMDFWKIPSGEVTNLPYLRKIAQTGKRTVLSTGMCEVSEIRGAVDLLKENGAGEITLLHCTTEYPAPLGDINLKAMQELREIFHLPVGYSDHTEGIMVPIAAVALGAEVIEKHFTLDKHLPGPDHKASLEPSELKAMVEGIRRTELALGDGRKRRSPSEQKNVTAARKSIVAARDIKKGELLSEENVTTKRPGSGISPMRWNEVLGTRAVRDFQEDELIEV